MNNFKSILWTILGIVIFIAIIKFFIFMLPFVIAVNRRKNHGESYNYYDKNSNGFEEANIDDSTNGQVIDVDYKEVDK